MAQPPANRDGPRNSEPGDDFKIRRQDEFQASKDDMAGTRVNSEDVREKLLQFSHSHKSMRIALQKSLIHRGAIMVGLLKHCFSTRITAARFRAVTRTFC